MLGAAFMICTAVAFWTVPKYIVRIYTPDPVVMRAATGLLFVAAFFQLFDGLQAVATGALRGAGDTRTPMICSVAFYWLIGLPWATFYASTWAGARRDSGLVCALR